jgi:mitogen-activated protein kinase kinase kinase
MAMLASKSPYPTPSLGGASSSQSSAQYNSSSTYRSHAPAARTEQAFFASPTESEFSELYDAPDAVKYYNLAAFPPTQTDSSRHWDEDKVGEWLKRINCPQYVDLFKSTPPPSAPFYMHD